MLTPPPPRVQSSNTGSETMAVSTVNFLSLCYLVYSLATKLCLNIVSHTFGFIIIILHLVSHLSPGTLMEGNFNRSCTKLHIAQKRCVCTLINCLKL